MRLFQYFRSLVSNLFHPSRLDREINEELHSHIELRADDLERTGMARAEALRRARVEFGGYERIREESHEVMGGNFFGTLVQDVRFSVRVLRKSPGFTIAAILTLALAIGANAVVFGVLNALILRPLKVPEAESLYAIERGKDKAVNHSYPDYRDLRERNRSFEDLSAYNVASVGLDTGNNPSAPWIFEVTGNYFDALHIQPYLGRFFHEDDERGPNSAPYIVLTNAFWQSHFQGDPGVVGRLVRVNKHPFTILGVAPAEFRGTISFVFPDFWVPLVNQEQVEGANVLEVRGDRALLMVLGHLKPGVTPGQAVADLNLIGADLEKKYPKDDGQMNFSLTRPNLTGDWFGGPLKGFLAALMLLAGMILLAACANLGSLFAARAADRSREVALRLALGASRTRILRQLFTEAMMISMVGGAIGLWGSVALLRALSNWRPVASAPLLVPVYADANVYWFALLLALVSGFLFSAVPVRQILRTSPYEIVKAGSTGRVGRRITLRDILLVVQIAICGVLVMSSLVAVRGLVRSLTDNLGFEPRNALLVETVLSMGAYSGDAVPVMQKRLVEALQAIPGVESAGIVDRPPLYYGANSSRVFSDKTTDLKPANGAAEVMTYNISPGYFDAARTTLLMGRTLNWHDDKNSPRVAVVNRQFASKIFGSVSNGVGSFFKSHDGTRVQVVGIVEDGKYNSLTEDPQPAMFFPIMQSPSVQTCVVVRSSRDTEQLVATIKSTLHDLDPGLPITVATWNQELGGVKLAPRMATISLGVLGVLGAMLAVTGIFGMAAYSVSKRLRELGIRVALGAQRGELLQAALGRTGRLLVVGSAAGLLLGLAASKVLAYIVYQATPWDPMVLGGVLLTMCVLGLVAGWIPARRALGTDPLILLREE